MCRIGPGLRKMACCRCNRTGLCRGCACVKANRKCSDCLPKRLGNCINLAVTTRTPGNQCNQIPPTPQVAQDSQASEGLQDSQVPQAEPCPTLPCFTPMSSPTFTWGEYSATEFSKLLEEAYHVVVHWRKNCFIPPQNKAGKEFVSELARLYLAFGMSSTLESIALKATIVLPLLLLQKPHRTSKNKDHTTCLERRMDIWRKGDLSKLVDEGKAIQNRLPNKPGPVQDKSTARSFANLMFAGKCKAALDILNKSETNSILHLDDPENPNDPNSLSVKDILINKHPTGQEAYRECIIDAEPQEPHPIIFEAINSNSIRSCALKTRGAAGPSGLDAHTWRRLCTTYKGPSSNLCESLALVAKRICSTYVDPNSMKPLLACRLIALSKNPGVRPIGVGDTARRIIAKSITQFLKCDIQQACGCQQLCGGQLSGVEAAVHATKSTFEAKENEAILLVDASNAFNSLNRQVALQNIRRTCPSIATALINTYREPTELFVDGNTLLSQEGTTQGDPLAMAMYGLATIPLIRRLEGHCKQVWYADDSAAIGQIKQLRTWWDTLSKEGPKFGYFPNPSKTWLIVKDPLSSISAFANTGINITTEGRPYLGAAIGTEKYIEEHVKSKVAEWTANTTTLSLFAKTQPHASYAALTHGLMSKWTYLSRVMPAIGQLLQPLDECIQTNLIPALTGRPPPNTLETTLHALPARLGGLGISIPSKKADSEFRSSLTICAPLVEGIHSHDHVYSLETLNTQLDQKKNVRRMKNRENTSKANELKELLPVTLQRAMDLASEKGASSWLTALPLLEHGFTLHKGAFQDALALRYGWNPINTPTKCSCGKDFSTEHALSCAKGGFPTIRHNEIRDLTATLLTEICNDVCIEPTLQPITEETLRGATANTQDGARLDISANGVWGGRQEKTYFDVRVFNPHAPSNKGSLTSCYNKHEREKKRSYEQRIREIEHASFTPLVMSTTGGIGREATTFYKRLASLLSYKWDTPYSHTLNWLRCRLSFSLLRSSIQAIRGARSSRGKAVIAAELAMEESRLQDP